MKTAPTMRNATNAGPRALAAAALTVVGLTAAAPAENYALDPVHSKIGFSITHLGISKVKGEFTNYTGHVSFKKDAMESLGADVAIQVSSVDTRQAQRDQHLQSEDFFNAKKFPEIRFKAEKAEKRGDTWFLVGTFTMHGVSKTLELPVTINGPIKDPWGNQRIGLATTAVLDRQAYGVGSDKLSDKAVGKDVTIEIDVEATAKKAE